MSNPSEVLRLYERLQDAHAQRRKLSRISDSDPVELADAINLVCSCRRSLTSAQYAHAERFAQVTSQIRSIARVQSCLGESLPACANEPRYMDHHNPECRSAKGVEQ